MRVSLLVWVTEQRYIENFPPDYTILRARRRFRKKRVRLVFGKKLPCKDFFVAVQLHNTRGKIMQVQMCQTFERRARSYGIITLMPKRSQRFPITNTEAAQLEIKIKHSNVVVQDATYTNKDWDRIAVQRKKEELDFIADTSLDVRVCLRHATI